MKVLYCASEVAPLIKVGGLGDVAGSLPKALAKLGVEIKIMVPRYEDVKTPGSQEIKVANFVVPFAGQAEQVFVWQINLPKTTIPVLLLENNQYLSKDGHQAFTGTVSEVTRFAFFSRAIAEYVKLQMGETNNRFNLLHLNDWHTSLVPLLLSGSCPPLTDHLPSLLTIHNLSYQGIAPVDLLQKLDLQVDACEFLKWDAQNSDIDLLMEGINHADYVNTVSPTYAQEILTPEFGWGIEGVLQKKTSKLSGILNGIDTEVWDPSRDQLINTQYDQSNYQMARIGNKKALQKELGLWVNERIPVLAFVGRLEPRQKGLDILYQALEKLLERENLHFILLGTGDQSWQKKFQALAANSGNKMVMVDRFDERLAHEIYAGTDLILVPSKFEPCGLPQMIAMRYGGLPIVRKTGGLTDSVLDKQTGFVFEEYSASALLATIRRALLTYFKPKEWAQMVTSAMNQDFSWDKSARSYLELYHKVAAVNK